MERIKETYSKHSERERGNVRGKVEIKEEGILTYLKNSNICLILNVSAEGITVKIKLRTLMLE